MKKVKEEKNIFWNNNWDRNIVKDENAAELYSRLSIFWFSVIFTVAIGAFLQALNCKNLGVKKGSYLTAVFGIIFTVIQSVIFIYIEIYSKNKVPIFLTFLFCSIGAYILDYYFWTKYIGDTEYRKKGILKPLLFSILIVAPIIIARIYGKL